jgi:hypothetical protein
MNALILAETWFMVNDPGVSPSSDAGQMLISLSRILDDYNNGIIGPGHCEE